MLNERFLSKEANSFLRKFISVGSNCNRIARPCQCMRSCVISEQNKYLKIEWLAHGAAQDPDTSQRDAAASTGLAYMGHARFVVSYSQDDDTWSSTCRLGQVVIER
jgi:hypothetical protein